MSPAFAWKRYLRAADAPRIKNLNVVSPEFFSGMQNLIASEPLQSWKTYLRWHLVHSASRMLPPAFVDETFNFYGKTLTGTKEIRPRWKRCVQYTDADLGEALGQPYVAETFGPKDKERTLKMVQALENALHEDIQQLSWMTEPTKKQALAKLQKVINNIRISRQVARLLQAQDRARRRLGQCLPRQPLRVQPRTAQDRQAGKPQRVADDATYRQRLHHDPQMNSINFPAGILQPPFFDTRLDDAVNFGAIGAVIGHELNARLRRPGA